MLKIMNEKWLYNEEFVEYPFNMKQRVVKNIALISIIVLVFGGFSLSVLFSRNNITKLNSIFAPELNEDLGKIKFVDGSGRDVFVSSSGIKFVLPVSYASLLANGDEGLLNVGAFAIVCAPAFAVVTDRTANSVTLFHGVDTFSTLSGLIGVGVKVGDFVLAGDAIGTAAENVSWAIEVDGKAVDVNGLFVRDGED